MARDFHLLRSLWRNLIYDSKRKIPGNWRPMRSQIGRFVKALYEWDRKHYAAQIVTLWSFAGDGGQTPPARHKGLQAQPPTVAQTVPGSLLGYVTEHQHSGLVYVRLAAYTPNPSNTTHVVMVTQ